MTKLKNELSWSFSRDQLFKECRRAYFYYYYASWGGWEVEADEFTRRAYLLKNMRNIDGWIGDIVHQVIKWILENKIVNSSTLLKTNEIIPYPEAVAKAKQILLKTWEQSRSKMWMKNIKSNLNLFEHYYQRSLSREKLAQKLQKVTKSIHNIYHCGLIDYFMSLSKDKIIHLEELDSFNFEGVKVFAMPDFAVYDRGYKLYDWKTGRRNDKDILQLSCYALYAMNKWNAFINDIKIVPVYLAEEKVYCEPISNVDIEKIKNYIRDSIKEMNSLLSSVSENKTDIKNYPKTVNLRCGQNCRFKEICA